METRGAAALKTGISHAIGALTTSGEIELGTRAIHRAVWRCRIVDLRVGVGVGHPGIGNSSITAARGRIATGGARENSKKNANKKNARAKSHARMPCNGCSDRMCS
jgi:hypothetical protein